MNLEGLLGPTGDGVKDTQKAVAQYLKNIEISEIVRAADVGEDRQMCCKLLLMQSETLQPLCNLQLWLFYPAPSKGTLKNKRTNISV